MSILSNHKMQSHIPLEIIRHIYSFIPQTDTVTHLRGSLVSRNIPPLTVISGKVSQLYLDSKRGRAIKYLRLSDGHSVICIPHRQFASLIIDAEPIGRYRIKEDNNRCGLICSATLIFGIASLLIVIALSLIAAFIPTMMPHAIIILIVVMIVIFVLCIFCIAHMKKICREV